MTPVLAGIGLINSVLGIVDKFVKDKDLAAKLKFEMVQTSVQFSKDIQTSEHVPGYIKFMYALRDVIIPLLRPAGSAAMSAFAAYAAVEGIEMSEPVQAAMAAAFPGWMYSRHRGKADEQKTEQAKQSTEQWKQKTRQVEAANPIRRTDNFPDFL